MVSTLLGYRLYANNISKSLERIEATTSVRKDAEYYAEHIGDVSSVDDFLDDYRLYSYAMKAYGLEDQVASKGLMRKVLESDLSDSSSFANKLVDSKYRNFAAAFNFKALATTDTKVVQSSAQTDTLVEAYTERRVRQGATAAARTSAYSTQIQSVSSVDDILANPALYDVILASIGVDPATASKDFVRQALTGTLPDTILTSNPGWLTLHEKFNFDADGSVKNAARSSNAKMPAQSEAQTNSLINDYNVATGNNSNSYAAAFNTDYYASTMAGVDDVDDLVGNKRLFDYVMTAFGFDPSNETAGFVRQILTSASGDPTTTLAQMQADTPANVAREEKFQALRAAFNFDTTGAATRGEAQTTAQLSATSDRYFQNYKTIATQADTRKTSSFKYLLGNINSVTDLLATDPTFGRDALNYVLSAFDIDPATTSLAVVRRVLTSDVSDPNSYVNKLKDERFEKLAAAFNFDADGKATTQRLAQSVANQTATGTKYAVSFGTMSEAKKAVVKTETKAYLTAIGKVRTLDDLLADTKTVAFALKAYGLEDASLSTDAIRKILTSDLGDRKSFANAANNRKYVEFAKAFNFEPDGTVRLEETSAQASVDRLSTENLFLLQTLESKAGEENEGVRLGLYFLRKAPDLASTTAILADKALLQVVKVAFGLPDGFSQLDVDRQVAILDKKLKIADFKDPKKLDRFISRFASLYDVANPQASSGGSAILQLFGGASSAPGIFGLL